jgi:KUP system potassium uptake protein
VLHERVIILNVKVEEVPHVSGERRVEFHEAGAGFYRMILHYGFMDEVDIPADLAFVSTCGEPFNMMRTSFFLGRQKLVAAITFTVLTTWATGRRLLRERLEESSLPLPVFVKSARSAHRIKGTSVFLSASPDSIPSALLHNLKHNQVLHERVVILTVKVEEVPHVPSAQRLKVDDAGGGFYRLVLRYGFMDEVDIPRDLAAFKSGGVGFHPMSTSFFLGRQTLVSTKKAEGMALWREKLFAWMLKSSESAMEFFKLPTNRVVELGSQLQI